MGNWFSSTPSDYDVAKDVWKMLAESAKARDLGVLVGLASESFNDCKRDGRGRVTYGSETEYCKFVFTAIFASSTNMTVVKVSFSPKYYEKNHSIQQNQYAYSFANLAEQLKQDALKGEWRNPNKNLAMYAETRLELLELAVRYMQQGGVDSISDGLAAFKEQGFQLMPEEKIQKLAADLKLALVSARKAREEAIAADAPRRKAAYEEELRKLEEENVALREKRARSPGATFDSVLDAVVSAEAASLLF